MNVNLSISSEDLSDDDLQTLTRSLCMTLNNETEVKADLVELAGEEGTKGLEIAIGLIALFMTSGSAVAMFNVLKSYAERDSSIKLEIEREDGKSLKIETQNLSSRQIDRTFERAREFFGDS